MHISIRSKKMQREYQEGCKQYSMAELKTIIRLIAQFDLKLRSLKSPLHSTIVQWGREPGNRIIFKYKL